MALASAPALTVGAAPRVNLMPRSERERRGRNALLRRWAWGLVAALLVVVLAAAGASALQLMAQQRLALENARTQTLLTQIAELQPVSRKLALEEDLAGFRSAAMASDLEWSGLLSTVQTVLPPGVTVDGFVFAPGGVPATDDPATEIGAFGELTLWSQTPTEIVTLVRALRPIPSVLQVDGWEAKAEEAGYAYVLRIAFDQTVYTHAFAEEAAE